MSVQKSKSSTLNMKLDAVKSKIHIPNSKLAATPLKSDATKLKSDISKWKPQQLEKRTPKTMDRTCEKLTHTQRSWVTCNSPLWRKDRIKTREELNYSLFKKVHAYSAYEKGFVNDAVRTHACSSRRNPIIPVYNAFTDKCVHSYLQSPLVQSVIERNRNSDTAKEQNESRTINKLSVRRRCMRTPDESQVRKLEDGFINDAITTERTRTKYKDIIPPYDARGDKLCKSYFERKEIKKVDRQDMCTTV